MAEDNLPWPNLSEPATKGDIGGALVGVYGCIIQIRIALSASRRGDDEKVEGMLDELSESIVKLSSTIDAIGGKRDS